jgi:hypothetical protein
LEASKKTKKEREAILANESSSFDAHKEKEKLVGKFLFKTDEVSASWLNVSS